MPQKKATRHEDSFKYIDHVTALESDSSKALREVAKHMIYQGPVQTAGRQAKFEESVDLKNKLAEIQKKVEAGTVTTAELKICVTNSRPFTMQL